MLRTRIVILSKYFRKAAIASVIVSACFSFPEILRAQSLGGFAFDAFDADITLEENGTFDVVETLQGEFFEYRHGIYRNIPFRYQTENGLTKSIRIHVEEVLLDSEPVSYEVFKEGDYQVVKIGDPDETVIGPFTYSIAYSVERAMIFGEQQDELYWNVTGDDWDVLLPSVHATVHIPAEQSVDLAAACYTGPYGFVGTDCTVDMNGSQVSVAASDFLTIAVGFPKGIIAEPTAAQIRMWWLQDNWDMFFLLVPLLAFVLLFFHWWTRGRDPKGRGTIIAEYDPPGDLRPTEVGTLIDTRVHPKDFSAALVDLAVRGYLRIIEKENKILLFSKKSYTFQKLKTADGNLRPYEKEILDAIFPSGKTESTLTDRTTALAKARTEVSKMVYEDLAEKGYYVRNPNTVRWMFFGMAIGLIACAHILGGGIAAMTGRPFVIAAGYATALVFILYAPLMPKKTEEGVRLYEHAKGFREFLKTAEKDRLKWQEKEGLFEQFLPYAMVYGVADKWAKVFEGIQAESPSWYVGAHAMQFNAADFSRNVSSFVDTSAKVAAPSSSGGSGGGGFSGGGFGGGGGGSW